MTVFISLTYDSVFHILRRLVQKYLDALKTGANINGLPEHPGIAGLRIFYS